MAPRKTATSKYEDAIANLPEEAFLGSLLWFSINGADVNLEQARADLTARGLDLGQLRKVLRPVDAFRKSARDINRKFKPVDGIRSELMVRPAGEDAERVHMFVMLERAVNQSGRKRRIFYEKVGELEFERGAKKDGEYSGYSVDARRTTMHLGTPLTHDEDSWLTGSLAEFEDRFLHLLHFMDSHAVRTFVREYIEKLSGTLVKESGGVYFVKQEHAKVLASLGEWVRSIGSHFQSVPLLNLADQRAMILQAFEDETVKEVERLMEEVATILKDPERQIEAKTFDAYGSRAAELQQKVAEYNSMLGSRADRAALEIKAYAVQVLKLTGRIRQGTTKGGPVTLGVAS